MPDRLVLMAPLLLTLAASSGCVGSVSVDGDAGNFGAASSGSLVELRLDDEVLRLFIISSRPGLCSNLQDAYPAAMDAADRWGFDIFDDGACNQLWEDLDAAWADVLGNGVNLTVISRAADGELLARPEEGSFEVGDGEWALELHYQDDNVYSTLAEERAGCAPDEGELTRSYRADTGELEVSGDDDSGWRLDFDVALEDEEGDDAGDAVGSFATRSCEVEVTGTSLLEWGFTAGVTTPWLID
jgi:hypothetical protein